jgi:hypothetical protein
MADTAPWPAPTQPPLPLGRPYMPSGQPLAPAPPVTQVVDKGQTLEAWVIVLIVVGVIGALAGIIACTWVAAMYTMQHQTAPSHRLVFRGRRRLPGRLKSPSLLPPEPAAAKRGVMPHSSRPSSMFRLRQSQPREEPVSSQCLWSHQYVTSEGSLCSNLVVQRRTSASSSFTTFLEQIGLRDADLDYYDLVELPASVHHQGQPEPLPMELLSPQKQGISTGASSRSRTQKNHESLMWTFGLGAMRSHAAPSSRAQQEAEDPQRSKGAIMYRMAEAMQVRLWFQFNAMRCNALGA